ncbi:mycothiol conjugate amidase Mca [Corynebacterium massiliense]|uniref:Mycothiol S-conjugate amidase n=1 Tax=Corynebacterium massiliense DSM 45435 TaxID=1121364 RepID=A0ABY7U6K2_9CORY|nr:mycothiol conjugate amidase Mca [Corynebacterium massiliense]WCZ32199.1 Mycothiol S-conjugate amidase [Corynebacterium massiliense DSM 45435]
MSTMRLLAVHAHPDDESSKGGATMARYAAEGHEVMVLTCTGGERGSIINPAMDKPGVIENLPQVRAEEMAEAARALGVDHRWLGYEDSGLPEGDPLPPLPEGCFARLDDAAVAADIVKVIREFRPHVIITYDENGGYPHPDHLMVHRASMIAWDKAGDPDWHPELGKAWEPQKLYYTHGFIYQRMELLNKWLEDNGHDSPFSGVLERWKDGAEDLMQRVTTRVECGDYFENRDNALRAHRTQIDPDGFFVIVPSEAQKEIWSTEEFELASSRVETTLPEDDLFAGIEGYEPTKEA